MGSGARKLYGRKVAYHIVSGARREFTLPFGRGELAFTLPRGMNATLLKPNHLGPVRSPSRAVADALAAPLGCAPLREIARRGQKVALVVTDTTRACPDYLLVPPILAELNAAGVPDSDIRVVVGIGMHRPTTKDEQYDKLGHEVCSRVEVLNPTPDEPESLADLGTTPNGVPITVSKLVADADLVVATGIVEPHQYAGYSGGCKTVAIGAAGEPTIRATHSPQMLDNPGTRLARLEDNPFYEAITEAGLRAGLRFILNVVQDDDLRILAVRAGEPVTTHRTLAQFAASVYTRPIQHQFDIAIAGVGYPKDANLYQASRAASYLFFAPTPVVREGGAIVIAAACPEGVGTGVGEASFYRIMRSARRPSDILAEARERGYPPGGQRAFVMAKVLESCVVYVAGAHDPEVVAHCKMIPVPSVEDALDDCASRMGSWERVLVVPHALQTLPVLTEVPSV